jgi:glycosyltransferase involved in cell wall biosynthesis
MPKVLIFGQPFNDFSGGGITLTNLFRGWPKEDLAVAYMGFGLYTFSTDVCDTYYQLGIDEYNWRFPFNLIQRKFPSGLKTNEKTIADDEPVFYIQKGLRYEIVNKIFYPFLRWTGLFHVLARLLISDRFKAWLSEYKPDILYLQVSTREEIVFATNLIRYLKIPSVIHMMDDWPTTICNSGLFKGLWHNMIDREFRVLLNKIDLHLSISDAMSEEYKERYDKDFTAFHNPIEMSSWLPYSKTDFEIRNDHIKILYSGRIGMGIMDSLYEVADAIDSMNDSTHTVKFHIQTPTKSPEIIGRLKSYKCVVINPFASYDDLPKIFSSADILIMANDFDKSGTDYLKFSMPTKASEFMISGTPILVYAPEGAALTGFLKKHECAYCVTEQNKKALIDGIKYLLDNPEYRRKLSANSVEIAKDRFSTDIVRPKFQGMIAGLLKR